MTIIYWCHFMVGCLMQTPVKKLFSESLRIVDYKGIFIELVSGYSLLFSKVQRFTNQVCFPPDLSGRIRSTWLCLLDTSKISSRAKYPLLDLNSTMVQVSKKILFNSVSFQFSKWLSLEMPPTMKEHAHK